MLNEKLFYLTQNKFKILNVGSSVLKNINISLLSSSSGVILPLCFLTLSSHYDVSFEQNISNTAVEPKL